jgi:hypothetical protein
MNGGVEVLENGSEHHPYRACAGTGLITCPARASTGHDKHAGHSVEMFRNRFWVCLA